MQMNFKFLEFDKLTKCQHMSLCVRGPSKNEPRITFINPIVNFLWKDLARLVQYGANKAIFGHFWAKIVFFDNLSTWPFSGHYSIFF